MRRDLSLRRTTNGWAPGAAPNSVQYTARGTRVCAGAGRHHLQAQPLVVAFYLLR